MTSHSLLCEHCSANIRYTSAHMGKKARCPKCKQELVIPFPEVSAEEDDAPVAPAPEKASARCAGCGKPIKAGQTRCKRCKEQASAMLATRMQQETALETAYGKAAKFSSAKAGGGPFPHWAHIAALVITAGMWTPFYFRSYMIWKSNQD